ncbi:MAG: hypothetical protein WBM00_00375 [Solirubrobacterales bacterium]
MSETATSVRGGGAPDRARARRPSFAPVFWGSIALFAILFAFLTYQLTSGRDPSLSTAASGLSRPVITRKIVRRRIVTTVVPTPGSTSYTSGPTTTSSAPLVSSYGSGAVVTGAS